MRNIFLTLSVIACLTVNAQIFIQTGPNGATGTATTPPVSNTIVTTPGVTNTNSITTPSNTTTVTTPAITNTATTPATNTSTTFAAPTTNTSTVANNNYQVAGATEEVPPNAEPGKCYARCVIPTTYKYVTEQVVDQPKSFKKVKIPALFKTVYDTVITKPASTKKIQIPAEYETIDEQVMATPAATKWVKGKADAGCLSADPADCQVMCLVEVPATYKTVSRKVLKSQAYTQQVNIPMEYKIVTKEIKVKDESFTSIEVPATYKTVQKRTVDQQGGYQVWREILCGNDLTEDRIIQIQRALKAKGYNPGPIDNVFGSQTKAALIKFQKEKGLPVGNLNIETLTALGVK